MIRLRIGAHVPTRGRAANAVDEAEARGAEAFQHFVSNPRAWAPPAISHDAVREFRVRREAAGDALGALEREGLSGRLRLVHANDARDPRGSRRDRHAHIGQGHIGELGFRAILAHEAVRRVPVIIETPGKVEEDRRNLALLRRWAAG